LAPDTFKLTGTRISANYAKIPRLWRGLFALCSDKFNRVHNFSHK